MFSPFAIVDDARCRDDVRWELEASTVRWAPTATMAFVDTKSGTSPAPVEHHALTSESFSRCGFWEDFRLVLDAGAGFTPEEASGFSCAQWADLTFLVRADGAYGDPDCVAWGHDDAGLISGAYATSIPLFGTGELSDCRRIR